MVVVLFVVVLGIVGFTTIKNTIDAGKPDPQVAATVPSKAEAPYLVQTDSRYYYAKEVVKDGDNYILKRYWAYNGSKWVMHPGELVLSKEFNVKVGKQ